MFPSTVRPTVKKISRHIGSILCKKHYSTNKDNGILNLTKLTERKLLRIKGRDTNKFLQGIITNDINCLVDGHSEMMYTMFLNVQGRVLYDAFLYTVPGSSNEYFLECDANASDDVISHFKRYKLRAKVEISDASKELDVWTIFSCNGKLDEITSENKKDVIIDKDPRLDALGMRMVVPWSKSPKELLDLPDCHSTDSAIYKEHRYKNGIAEGVQEIPTGNAVPLEYNMALINGVSFSKGCYIGQELTARTHHTGLIRKRIMPIQLKLNDNIASYPELAPQTPIKTNAGKSAGRICSMQGEYGLGLLRLKELFDSEYLLAGCKDGSEVMLTAKKPTWWPQDLKY